MTFNIEIPDETLWDLIAERIARDIVMDEGGLKLGKTNVRGRVRREIEGIVATEFKDNRKMYIEYVREYAADYLNHRVNWKNGWLNAAIEEEVNKRMEEKKDG